MKRFAVAILSVLYLVTSTGATVSFHYCMGKFTGWDLSAVNSKCSNCGMKKKDQEGCCNDKQETIQLKKDQLASPINVIPGNSFRYLHAQYFSFTQTFIPGHTHKLYTAHSPPGLNIVSPLTRNCVFRI